MDEPPVVINPPYQFPADPDHILRLQCLAAAGERGDLDSQLLRAQRIYEFVTDHQASR